MRTGFAVALAGLGVLALGAGYYLSSGAIRNGGDGVSGSLAFPGLADRLQGIREVDVEHQGKVLQVVRVGDAWGLPAKGGYPIQANKLHEILTGLTELRLTEPRTSDPTEYARLGVEDPKDATATSNELRVVDGAGTVVADLIVGHRRVRTQGNLPETVYVRRPGDARSWLAEGRLAVDADPQLWIDRDIANIDHARIASATVTRGDEVLVFARDGERFVLTEPQAHPKLDDYKVEEVARAFETLTLMDVKPEAAMQGERLGSSLFTTSDGETISVTLWKVAGEKDAEVWAQFAVTGAEGAALERRVHGWAYQVGSWKESAFLPTMDALKAAEPAAAAK